MVKVFAFGGGFSRGYFDFGLKIFIQGWRISNPIDRGITVEENSLLWMLRLDFCRILRRKVGSRSKALRAMRRNKAKFCLMQLHLHYQHEQVRSLIRLLS